MRSRIRTVSCLVLLAVAGTLGAAEGAPGVPIKTASASTKLLLPLYLVDTTQPLGLTTQFAVRNESTATVEVRISYYETDTPQMPQRQDMIFLGPKEIRTFDIRFVANLEVTNGFARGFVIIETVLGDPVIHGDSYQINALENFASGTRLLDIGPLSTDNDLCSRFSMRFLDSALIFDSGTVYTVWVDLDAVDPDGEDIFSYLIYGVGGGLPIDGTTFQTSEVAFQVAAADLKVVATDEFGAIEFEFAGGAVGHISATLSALGKFSVGYEATCLD